MTFLRDVSLLIARVLLGGVLFAHGWQKYNDWKIAGTTDAFDGMGVPSPELSAQIATYFEMAGGILLILGLLVRFVGPILAVQMAGAFWFGHRGTEIFVSNGGWELVAVLGAAGLAIAGAGAGRISLDHLITAPFRNRKGKKEEATAGPGAVPAPEYTPYSSGAGATDSTYAEPQSAPAQNAPVESYNSPDAPTTAFPSTQDPKNK